MRIALNGFGRIGRSFLRALLEREAAGEQVPLELVAINDLGEAEDLAYLLQFDTTHGTLQQQVCCLREEAKTSLQVGRHQPLLLQQENAQCLPWKTLQVDLVLECTGEFRSYTDARQHLQAGAGFVVMGAVPFDDADAIVVYGVNHQQWQQQKIVSAASCTTHCIAPLLNILDQQWGVEQVLMQEVHAYTSDQSLLDHVHRDPRRGRAAASNIVPTTSSAIGAVQKVLPQLHGKISGGSIRVPTLNVAMVDLTVRFSSEPLIESLNQRLLEESQNQPALLGYNDKPLVSVDFNHRPESAIYDSSQSIQQGDMFRLAAWYDNEWGYANRLIDLLCYKARNKANN